MDPSPPLLHIPEQAGGRDIPRVVAAVAISLTLVWLVTAAMQPLGWQRALPTWLSPGILIVLGYLILFALVRGLMNRQLRRQIEQLVQRSDRTEFAVRQVLAATRGRHAATVVRTLTLQLARRGWIEPTLLVSDKPLAVEPVFAHPFEPAPLDETDAAALQLLGVTTNDDAHSDAQTNRMLARFARTWRTGEGVSLTVVALLFLNSAWVAWQAGRPGPAFYLWLAILVMSLGRLFTGHSGSRALVLPAGLAVATQETPPWRVHASGYSLLGLYRIAGGRWMWASSDGYNVDSAFCTEREATLLIRAWQSPLEPPTAEEVTALA